MPQAARVSDPSGERLIALAGRFAVRGVLVIAALSLVCNLASVAAPFYNMQVFNRVLPTRGTGTLSMLVIGAAAALLIFGVLDTLRTLAMEALAGQFARRLAPPLLNAAALGGRGGASVREALSDLETLRGFIASADCTAPFDAMWVPVLLLVLLTEHWGFAVLGTASCVILLLLNILADAISRRQMLAANEASADGFGHIADAANAAEAVLGLGMLPALTRKWEDRNLQAATLARRATLRARAIGSLTRALRMGMTGAMVALGLVLAIGGFASGGDMVASNMILARMLMPFQQVAGTRRRWVDALAAWRRIRRILEHPTPTRYASPLPAPVPRLVVERLVYMPPGADRPLLRGLSFAVAPGESIGVIGPSSAGKSTLARLILGMAPPTAGGVFLDGTSTFLWEREDFARHAGYVPQGLALLEESVAANIARMRAPDMAAVLDAAKRAGIHEVIAALPRGYATPVAGGTLSSGQRQRLALARALYRRPRLLVLDEPTAFLDSDGEREVIALLGRLRSEGTTVLVVTHRPTLLAHVDKLLVLEDGAISRFGTRAEILGNITAPRPRLEPARPAVPAIREAAS